MITAGVDLAASAASTAAAVLDWSTSVTVSTVVERADDDDVLAACADAERIGIDCPFGWPDPFVDLLLAHREVGTIPPTATIAERKSLVYRTTDRECQRLGHHPLSVAADRIGHAALRCAGLLARLGDPARDGSGRAVEAYPAAALKIWGLPHRGYKRSPERQQELLGGLERRVPLRFASPAQRDACARSDHALDAVITALIARAAALGRVTRPSPDDVAIARREGWIVLPTCALGDLR